MTKRRPSNKKPVGMNKSLGNALMNERDRNRKLHQKGKYDEGDIENAAFLEEEEQKVIDSIIDESGLEEFLAKAQLAGTEFSADRENVRIISQNKSVIVPSKNDFLNNLELQRQYEDKLRIPRRPPRDQWETTEELSALENQVFLKWREDLAMLQDVDGLTLTPFERNPEMWKELWRVVERSDLVVQIVDARNPLLFRSKDLESYVKEVDPAKKNVLLVNKSDLLPEEHVQEWADYFRDNDIDAIFWSATDEAEEAHSSGDEQEPTSSSSANDQVCFFKNKDDLLAHFKSIGHLQGYSGGKQFVVGMVGYPNVGKSSTINKLVGTKKVSVSATPGKTRHFQTIHIDKELCLCDCPGLVMPSFSFGRNEMFLNGIMPVDQMRDHFAPTSLLLSRVPFEYFEKKYSMLLPAREKPSPYDLLTTLAFNRGFMSASGIPDCSRAGRLLLKDVVSGKILWVAAPPGTEQEEFDKVLYPTTARDEKQPGAVQLQEMEKRGLLEGDNAVDRKLDSGFFTVEGGHAHVRSARSLNADNTTPTTTAVPSLAGEKGTKHHNNRNRKEKLKRVFVGTYA
ncbi:unnamed protein product, partial [Mesorhabditis spiculigera]